MYFSIEDILDKHQVTIRAKAKWDRLGICERLRKCKKYRHIAIVDNSVASWVDNFDDMDESHKNILIKGELIRTYDSMLMSDKRKLADEAKLDKFQTKWFKLSKDDKNKLLEHVLSIHKQHDTARIN